MASYIKKQSVLGRLSTSCGLFGRNRRNPDFEAKGDPDHPAAKGLICRKMQRYEKSIHSLSGFLYP